MTYAVYVLVNNVNTKMYVGCTERSLKERLCKHLSASKKCNYAISRAIRKHGASNFQIRMIEEYATREEMKQGEIEWIAYFNTYGTIYGYNSSKGGDGGENNGSFKKGHQGYWKGKVNPNWCGRKQTEESRRKMSMSLKGRKCPHKGKYWKTVDQKRVYITAEESAIYKASDEYRDNELAVRKQWKAKHKLAVAAKEQQ